MAPAFPTGEEQVQGTRRQGKRRAHQALSELSFQAHEAWDRVRRSFMRGSEDACAAAIDAQTALTIFEG